MSLLSATKLDRFADHNYGVEDGCQRRGAFHYWGRDYGYDVEPKGDNAELGIRLHKMAERYLEYKELPDGLTIEGEMFMQALPYLPEPGAGGVEGEKTLSISGIDYGMTLDLHTELPRRPGVKYPDGHPAPGRVYVGDHKTSSNPKAYGLWQPRTTGEGWKKKKGFLDDTQVILYAAWDMINSGDDISYLMWLYYGFKQTKRKDPLSGEVVVYRGPPFKVEPSYFTCTRTEVEEAFGRIVHPRAELVLSLEATKPDPKSLDPNPRSCQRFNKTCFHAPTCNLSVGQQLFGITKKKKEAPTMALSLKEALAAKKAAAEAAARGAQAQEEAAAAPAPASKPDLINPPEAAKTKPAGAGTVMSEELTTKHTPAPAPVVQPSNSNAKATTLAVIFEHLGEACAKIARDLR